MSMIAFVTPVIALLMGSVFGGEPLRPATLTGAGLVVSGLALVLSSRAWAIARRPRSA